MIRLKHVVVLALNCPQTGDFTSSTCACGCVVNGMSAMA